LIPFLIRTGDRLPYVRVIEGVLRKGDRFRFMANDMEYNAEDVGYLRMSYEPTQELRAGDVGYVIGSVKSLQDVRVGDTITHVKNGATVPIPGYQEAKPMVFSGIFPDSIGRFRGPYGRPWKNSN
jgi:GTP-binding protein LepA